MVPPPRRKGGKQGKLAKPRPRQASAEDLYMEAEMAYISDNHDRARVCFQRALNMDPENAEYLDGYGAFLAECGPIDEAVSVLHRACEASPNDGFEKFMYLGQVLDQAGRSSEAESSMRRGITILRMELENAPEGPDAEASGEATKEAFQEALCSALCSLAELLMGVAVETADEADDSAAAAAPALAEADLLLQEAQSLWPASPEPLQALASLRRVQGNDDEALTLLRSSMSKWHRSPETQDRTGQSDLEADASMINGDESDGKHDGMAAGGDAGEVRGIVNLEQQEQGGDGDLQLPSYEFRFETAKLLLELDDTTDSVVSVLEGLLEENDGVPDVWLLLAVAYRAGGELDEAVDAARKGVAVAKRLGLPPEHEVSAALEDIEGELTTLGHKSSLEEGNTMASDAK